MHSEILQVGLTAILMRVFTVYDHNVNQGVYRTEVSF